MKQRNTNVLLISIDTCRADALSCYGCKYDTTPNIDAVAREGVLFEHVVSPAPITLPSHSSIMTGAIPPQHGVRDNITYKLDESNLTLAEVLKKRGYTTGAVIGSLILDSQFGLAQGFDYYNDVFEKEIDNEFIAQRRGEEVSALASKWLKEHRNDELFLFLHYFDPHAEYVPPEPFKSRIKESPFLAEVAYADHCIGQVLNDLKSLGLYDSTLIIITSDHGESLYEHGEATHSYYIYDSTIRVPLIIKLPKSRESKRVGEYVGLIDIFPTVMGVLNLSAPQELGGIDLGAYIDNPDYSNKLRPLYTESLEATKYLCSPLLGVVSDSWKYIHTNQPELYDLRKDPGEVKNLASEEPKRVGDLESMLRNIYSKKTHDAAGANRLTLDQESLEKLEGLGYLMKQNKPYEQFQQSPTEEDAKSCFKYFEKFRVARVHIADRKLTEAKKELDDLIEQRPDMTLFQNEAAHVASLAGDSKLAVKHYLESIRIEPNDASVLQALGLEYAKQGAFESARERFLQALKMDPANSNLLVDLAKVEASRNRPDKAIEYFRKALKLKPDNQQALTDLGVTMARFGRIKESVALLEKAVENGPDDQAAHGALANAYIKMGNWGESLKHLKEVLRINPKDAKAHMMSARVYAGMNSYESVVRHLNQTLEIAPDNIEARSNLASAYYKLGKKEQAYNEWNLALTKNPDYAAVLLNLSWNLATDASETFRDANRAISLAKRACKITQNRNPSCLDALAASFATVGKFDEAIKTAQKALEIAGHAGNPGLSEMIQRRLKLYERRQPFRQPQ